MTPQRESSHLSARALRRVRASAAALLVDLVRLEAGLARLEPEDLHAHPEARGLAKLICEAPGLLGSRIDELADAIAPLRDRTAAPPSAFIVRLEDLAAPCYLELLLVAARRHVALLVHQAAAAGVATTVADREVRLQSVFEAPPAPVSYMTLGACVEQELRVIEQSTPLTRVGTSQEAESGSVETERPSREPNSDAGAANSESGRGLLSCADLAATFGVDQERLRGRLKRWQRTCFTGWVEVTDRGPRDPQYLYHVSSVMPIIRALQNSGKEKR